MQATASRDPALGAAAGDDDWGEAAASRECALLRPSTPQPRQPPDATELPRARITSEDIAGLYPSPSYHPSSPPVLPETKPGRGASGGTKLHSLQTLCLGVVGQYLEQYVEQLGPEGLSWLPPDMKAVLVAVARRHRTLHDPVLLALSDPGFSSLDLWGCGTMLSDKAIRQAVCSMRHLQALDITGCTNISARTLRSIAACCPHLKLLRLGVEQVEQAAAKAMPDILPRVDAVAEEHVAEHWEALLDPGVEGCGCGSSQAPGCLGPCTSSSHQPPACGHESGPAAASSAGGVAPPPAAAAAAAFGRGRLVSLRWLIWPGAPRAVQSLLALQCPKVQLNPMPAALSALVARTSAAAAAAQRQQQLERERLQREEERRRQRWRQDPSSQQQQQQQQQQQGVGCDSPSVAGLRSGGSGPGVLGCGGSSGPLLAPGSWDPLDPMCALDQPLVERVGPAAWEGLHSGSDNATPQAAGCASIAEKIRESYVQREQRLRALEQRFRQEQRRAEADRRQLRRRGYSQQPAGEWGWLD